MASTIIVALDRNIRSKLALRGSDPDAPLTGRRVQANLLFYATIVLTLWFFWNWFYGFFPQNEPDVVGLVHLEMWTLINPIVRTDDRRDRIQPMAGNWGYARLISKYNYSY